MAEKEAENAGVQHSEVATGILEPSERSPDFSEVKDMRQGLRSRHLQMIALQPDRQ